MIIAKGFGFIGNRIKFLKSPFLKIRDKLIFKYIDKTMKDNKIIENINFGNSNEKAEKNIWIYWAQGIESAPILVKKCIFNMKECCKEYNINIITNDNLKEYIDIPKYILEKVRKKKITLTHFSDIIRVNLLAKYGGIWIDSTVFVNNNFEDFINDEFEIITIPQDNINYNVSGGKWSAWLIGTKSILPYFKVCSDFFNIYWEKNDVLITYFLIDYVLEYMYRTISDFKLYVDKSNKVDYSVYQLVEIRNEKCTFEQYNKFLNNHIVNKLNYKIDYKINEKDTFSYYLFN